MLQSRYIWRDITICGAIIYTLHDNLCRFVLWFAVTNVITTSWSIRSWLTKDSCWYINIDWGGIWHNLVKINCGSFNIVNCRYVSNFWLLTCQHGHVHRSQHMCSVISTRLVSTCNTALNSTYSKCRFGCIWVHTDTNARVMLTWLESSGIPALLLEILILCLHAQLNHDWQPLVILH